MQEYPPEFAILTASDFILQTRRSCNLKNNISLNNVEWDKISGNLRSYVSKG